MADWEHLTKMAIKHEAALIAFLASIERPGDDDDGDYADFHSALETALGWLGDARAIAQATPTMQGILDEDGKRLGVIDD